MLQPGRATGRRERSASHTPLSRAMVRASTSRCSLMATQALASGSPANNPLEPSAGEIEALYASVWEG